MSDLDASQANVEIQPHSLSIPSEIVSPYNSSDIVMIDNVAMSNSPHLKLMEKPTLSIDTHHVEKYDLLKCQSFISSPLNTNSSTVMTSTDVSYPLITSSLMDNPSIDIPYPLISSSSMDISHQSTTSHSTTQETQFNIISTFKPTGDEQLII